MKHSFAALVFFTFTASGFAMNIQSRINAASPGDIVEIPGGIYFENLDFPKDGEPERPITLRGARNEIVVINAGHPLEIRLTPVADLPEVFRGKVSGIGEETGIWEAGSRLRLKRVGSREECGRRLGAWFYDEAAGEIYLRSGGAQGADKLAYWVESDVPAITIKRSHIRVENLSLTLGGHGVLVDKKTRDVRVENCRAFCNKRAGIHVSGSGHVIAGNEVFANNQHGIQLRYEVENTIVRGNHCFFNGPRNGETTDVPEPVDLSLYSRAAYVLIENNIAEGFTKNAYRNKYGVNPTNVFRGNVLRGNANPSAFAGYNNTYLVARLGPREGMYLRERPNANGGSWDKVDPSGLQRAANLIHPADFSEDPKFADVAYSDYRLQAGSPALGRGAHPGFAPILYVDAAQGSAENDGLSQSRPLPTIAAALERAVAGFTIYLLPGTYAEDVRLNAGGLCIRAQGRSEKVLVTGNWTIAGAIGVKLDLNVSPGAANVEIDGLHFQSGALSIENAEGIFVRNCVFENAAVSLSGSEGARLDRNTFAGGSLKVSGEKRNFLTQSLLSGVAVDAPENALVSEFNHTGATFSFAPNFALPAGSPLAGAATDFGRVGARGEGRGGQMEIANLRVAGASPHGVTLLWDSPRQNTFAEVTLRRLSDGEARAIHPAFEFEVMGEYFDVSFPHDLFFGVERHVSLGELEPSQEYEAALTLLDFAGNRSEARTVKFKTPSDYATARTFYMSPDGNDEADGKTRGAAWKTFHHSLDRVGPGDTLVALPGVYREALRPRVSGTKEHPVRILAEKGAMLDVTGIANTAVEILNVDNVRVEGFALKSRAYSSGSNALVNNARNIVLRGFDSEYPPDATFTKHKLGANGLIAVDAPNLLVEDNLFIGPTIGIAVSASPDARVRHNTLVSGGNYGVVIVPGNAEEIYHVEGNLFDRAILDYKKSPAIRMFDPESKIVSDHNLFHIPQEHKGGIGSLPAHEAIARTLEEWRKASGLDMHSVAAEPLYENPEKADFRLKSGSPGKALLPDGSDVGARR